MPLHRLDWQPGFNSQATQTKNRQGWFSCNLVRWRYGLLEKLAGWQQLFATALAGICRALHAYEDLTPENDLLLGTDGGPQLYVNNQLYDLDIVRRVAFWEGGATMTPTSGSTQITVYDQDHGAVTGQEIVIAIQTSVGGQIIPANSTFTINVLDTSHYTFNMQYAATNANTGSIPLFTISSLLTTQQVTLKNHGYAIGDQFPIDQTTSYVLQTSFGLISFIVNAGTFLTVTNILDANNFTFTGGPYGDYSGSPNSIYEGTVDYDSGSGPLGNLQTASWIYYYASAPPAPVQWSIDNLGTNGLFVYITSPLFVYSPPLGIPYSGRTTVNTIRRVVPTTGGGASMAATSTSKTITVTDTGFGGSTNDTILISMTTAVGGQIIPGGSTFTITKIDADTYTFQMANAATNNNAGTTPLFLISQGTTQQITLADHGLSLGNQFLVDQTTAYYLTTVSGRISFYIAGGTQLTVTGVIDVNNFTFTGGPYLTGTVTTQNFIEGLTYYGSPTYGPWIQYTGVAPTMQQTWLGRLPEIFNAGPTTSVPQTNTGMLVAMPQAQVILWGTEPVIGSGIIDPLLLRFSDAGGYSDWTASATNQAGSFRLGGSGSRIVGGLQAPQTTLIWTDVDVWSMLYVGPPFIYSFTTLGSGCGLVAPLARAQLGRTVLWVSSLGFFSFSDSGIAPLECPVWDIMFNDLDHSNIEKVFCGTNSGPHEIWIFYPSISGGTGECDKYLKFNMVENLWDFGQLDRTAWLADNVFGPPLGTDADFIVQQHETGYDANGDPMAGVYAESGYADIAEGDQIMFVDEYISDMKWFGKDGAVAVSLYGVMYPGDNPTVKGPYGLDSTNRYIRPQFRARQIALRIDWATRAGFSARLGTPRVQISPAGRRP